MKKMINVNGMEVANQVVSMEYLLDIAIKKVEKALAESSIGDKMEYLVSCRSSDNTFSSITIQPDGLYEIASCADGCAIDTQFGMTESVELYQIDLSLYDLLNLGYKQIIYKIDNLFIAYKNSLFAQFEVEPKDDVTITHNDDWTRYTLKCNGVTTFVFDEELQLLESYMGTKINHLPKCRSVKSDDMIGRYEWKLVTA